MFWSAESQTPLARPAIGDRLRDVLDLARAFLTLEDEYDVDWEFGEERELAPMPAPWWGGVGETLGHRPGERAAPLENRGRRPQRRAGALPAPPQVCISPLPARAPVCSETPPAR